MKNKEQVFDYIKNHLGCTPAEILRGTGITPIQQVNAKLAQLLKEKRVWREEHRRTFKYYVYEEIPPVPAKALADREQDLPKHITKENTLIVISCTKGKIWDKGISHSVYIPAEYAYTGRSFQWLDKNRLKVEHFPWVILSAKYGFIEPEHPIGYYDVTFSALKTGPISDESLKNQVHQKRHFGNQDKELGEFKYVLVRDSEIYFEKAKRTFTNTSAIVKKLDDNLWHQIVRTVDP